MNHQGPVGLARSASASCRRPLSGLADKLVGVASEITPARRFAFARPRRRSHSTGRCVPQTALALALCPVPFRLDTSPAPRGALVD